jgi:hypothetical protein
VSRYHGRQGAGAARRAREQRRREAQARNAVTSPHRRRAARRPCPTGKVRYADERAARVELVGLVISRNRGDARRHERRVYQCPRCFGWHTTSKPKKPLRMSWKAWRERLRRGPRPAAA